MSCFFIMMPSVSVRSFTVLYLLQLFRRELCCKLWIIFYSLFQLFIAFIKLFLI